MSTDALAALRKHRHDVLNELQLIKGNLQLNRVDRAMRVVNRCAEWLASVSELQASVPEAWQPLVWTAVGCPHLRVRFVRDTRRSAASPEAFATSVVAVAAAALEWLETAASEQNMERVTVSVRVAATPRAGHQLCVGIPLRVYPALGPAAVEQFPAVKWEQVAEDPHAE
ncbi:MAG: Spo0B domain-containing protein [Alicyclobacillus sp.]|nr:Spo0B domain-containing protein [Alicyclobacillus sp.]